MKRQINKKPIQERISLYLDGKLNEKEIDKLWIDIIKDSDNLEYLKKMADIDLQEDDKKTFISKEPKNSKPVIKYFYFFALLGLLVLIASIYLTFQNELASNNQAFSPIEHIELNYPGSSQKESTIADTLELFNLQEYQSAINIITVGFEQTNNNNDKAIFLLYSGSFLYNTNKFQEAASKFDQLVKLDDVDTSIKERAYWYLGNSYFQLNEPEATNHSFSSVVKYDGAFSEIANSYLNNL